MSWHRALLAVLLIAPSQLTAFATCECSDEPARHLASTHVATVVSVPGTHAHAHAHVHPHPAQPPPCRDPGTCPVGHGQGDAPDPDCVCTPGQPLALEQAWPLLEGVGHRILPGLAPSPAVLGRDIAMEPAPAHPPPHAASTAPPCPSSSSPSTLPVLLV